MHAAGAADAALLSWCHFNEIRDEWHTIHVESEMEFPALCRMTHPAARALVFASEQIHGTGLFDAEISKDTARNSVFTRIRMSHDLKNILARL